MWQVIGRGLVVCAAAVLAASFAGELHGLGDSLAVFRPVILVGCLLVAALVWRWQIARILAGLVFALGLWHMSGFVFYDGLSAGEYDRPTDNVNFTIYQKNLLFRPRDRTQLIVDIREADADVVTLQEVSQANQPILESLRDIYPYQVLCNAHSVGAVAILSHTVLSDVDCGDHAGFARAVTQVRGRSVQVVSVHVHWPWPYRQQDHARRLLSGLRELQDGATVIGGDFNMVASGRSIAWFEQATQTDRVGPLVRTYDLFGYPLGIDHVLATNGIGTVSARPQFGSDHFGLLAQIELP